MRAFFRIGCFSLASLALLASGWMMTWGNSCGGIMGIDLSSLVFLVLLAFGSACILFLGKSLWRTRLLLGSAMIVLLGYGLGAMPPLSDSAAMLVYFGSHLAPPCGAEFGFVSRVLYTSLASEIVLHRLVGYGALGSRGAVTIFRLCLWLFLVGIMSGFLYYVEGSFGFLDIPEPEFFRFSSGLFALFPPFSSTVRT
jgi:hypothetical protein